jgi:hypothetical protein
VIALEFTPPVNIRTHAVSTEGAEIDERLKTAIRCVNWTMPHASPLSLSLGGERYIYGVPVKETMVTFVFESSAKGSPLSFLFREDGRMGDQR